MASIDAQKLYKDIEKGSLYPLYFVYGEEPYLLHQALKRFEYQVLPEGMADFNLNIFLAGEAHADTVREAVETLPMMTSVRLVILKEAQDWNDKNWEVIEPVISNPVSSTVLVIAAQKIDKRKKVIRLLLEKAMSVEFKKPYENQIPSWIKYITQQYQGQIENEAIQLLHKYVGSSLSALDSEIQKLLEYVGGRAIEARDVKTLVSKSKEKSVFDFARAVGLGQKAYSLELLVQLLDQGQNEIAIVQLLARHIRLLLNLNKGQSLGFSGAKLAQYAQVPPYFLDNYLQQADLWSNKKLENVLVILSETDRALKSSPLSSHIWLENMVFRIGAQNKDSRGQALRL
ncbi:MAG: DNA polymerase III subunit delta [Pseudobdellovibrionaceae bacterium]